MKMKNIKSFNNYSNLDEGYKNVIISSILSLISFFPKMSHAQDYLSSKDGYEHTQQMKKDYDNKIQDLITEIEEMYPNEFREHPFSQLKHISQKNKLQKYDLKTLDEIESIVNHINKRGFRLNRRDERIRNIINDIIWSIRNNEEISDERMLEIEKVINDSVNGIEDPLSENPSFFGLILITIGLLLAPLLLLRELWIDISGRGGIPRY